MTHPTPKPNTGDVEQLREQFLTLGSCIGPYDSPHRCSAMHCDHCGLCDISEEVLALIAAREAEARHDEATRAFNVCLNHRSNTGHEVGLIIAGRLTDLRKQLTQRPKAQKGR